MLDDFCACFVHLYMQEWPPLQIKGSYPWYQRQGNQEEGERAVANIPSLAPQFERELNNREWGHLEIYPSPANVDITKEFYKYAKALGREDEMYFSYVRGKRVAFDADTINCFLGIDWEEKQCQFATSMLEGVDYEDVEQNLFVPRGHFQRNRSGAPIHIIRPHLTPLAKVLNINIGQVVADEIQSCARGATSKAPLGHPSLITHLCEAAGIDDSRPPLEPPRKELDAAYFTHYYAVDEAAPF
ncbi:hypothetical protein LR48_Vigan03g164400 [Vigna angularis]|uniref:Putative plant transposon protein domain-containing protein n=1 Tax=Phaseolus angularis TaxID=3914 RepID=A0A0L9U6H1_PHAAN|nr:hypothetical protein LR48_Vigan03g164400 [Vigna angularis]